MDTDGHSMDVDTVTDRDMDKYNLCPPPPRRIGRSIVAPPGGQDFLLSNPHIEIGLTAG
jgi:hypothetical protein